MGTLRFLLALSVAWTHAELPHGLSGDLCVTIFFVISGFYMSMVLSENRTYCKIGAFYKQRALRLFPTYWVVFLASLAMAALLPGIQIGWATVGKMNLLQDHPSVAAAWLLSQALILGQDIFMFFGLDSSRAVAFSPRMSDSISPMAGLLVVPQAWSLSLELFFYLIAPFIVRRSKLFIGGLLLTSCLTRILLAWTLGFSDDPWATRFFPSEFAFFLLGMLGYLLITSAKVKFTSHSSLIYLVLCAVAVASMTVNHFGHVNVGLFSKAALATFLLIAFIPWLFTVTRESRLDRHIGEYSYPLYLSHVLVFNVWDQLHWSSAWSGYLMIVLAVAVAVAVATAVDKPVDRFRHRLLSGELKC